MIKEFVVKQNELPIHLLQTSKFKTIHIALYMKTNMTKEKATHRALLSHVLKSATKNYPSRKDIRLYLDDLYGATLSTSVEKIGDSHIIVFYMTVVHEKFLQKERDLFQKSIAFLKEIVLHPYLDAEGNFSEKLIEEEKRLLKQRIDAIYDDKIRYANERLIQEMCKHEPFSIHPYGDKEVLSNVTKESLKEEYNRMLKEDDVTMYIVGDVQKEAVEEAARLFTFPSRLNSVKPIVKHTVAEKEAQEVIEKDAISQAKLSMGFRFPVTHEDERFYAAQVMNGLFGGFPHSKLFMNVREKESLAYYAASRYESAKGFIFAFAGIDASKYEKTTAIIKKQLEAVARGEFTEQELAQTKMMLKNQLLEAYDSPRSIMSMAYKGYVLGKVRDLDSWLKGIEGVEKNEVTRVAQLVTLDTCFLLRGEDD